jgi:protein SCO1
VPFRWLLGTKAELQPIWKGYAVTPQTAEAEHMARIVLIDKKGMQRIGYPLDQTTPDRIAHDLRLLARE